MAIKSANLKCKNNNIDYPLNPYWIKGAVSLFPEIARTYGSQLNSPKITDDYDATYYFNTNVLLETSYILVNELGSYIYYLKLNNEYVATCLRNESSLSVRYDEYYSTDGGETYIYTKRSGSLRFTAEENYDFLNGYYDIIVNPSDMSSEETYQLNKGYLFNTREADPGIYADYDYLSLKNYCCPNNLGGVLTKSTSALHINGLSTWYFNDENSGAPAPFTANIISEYDQNGNTTDKLQLINPNYFIMQTTSSKDTNMVIKRGSKILNATIKSNVWYWPSATTSYTLEAGTYTISVDGLAYAKIGNGSNPVDPTKIGIEIIDVSTNSRILFFSYSKYEEGGRIPFTLADTTSVRIRTVLYLPQEGILYYWYISKIENLKIAETGRSFYKEISAKSSATSSSLITLSSLSDSYDYDAYRNVYTITIPGKMEDAQYAILTNGNIVKSQYADNFNFKVVKLPPVTIAEYTGNSIKATWNTLAVPDNAIEITATISTTLGGDPLYSISNISFYSGSCTFTGLAPQQTYYIRLQMGQDNQAQEITNNSIYYAPSNYTQAQTDDDGADKLTCKIDLLTYTNRDDEYTPTQYTLSGFYPASTTVSSSFWTNTSRGNSVYVISLISESADLTITSASPTITCSGSAYTQYQIPKINPNGWQSRTGGKCCKIAIQQPASYPYHVQYNFTVVVRGEYTYKGNTYSFSRAVTKQIPPGEEIPD